MSFFRKNPARTPIQMCEDFAQVAEAHERLRGMVMELWAVLPENTRPMGSTASNFESEQLLKMMARSIPSGPREQFEYNSAGCLSYGLRMFQGADVDSLFKQPEYLSKIMDFLETSRSAGAISPFEEMQSMCQLAYASAADVFKEHDKKRARENVAHILERLSESQDLYATSALALIQRKQSPDDVTAGQILKCLSKIQKNQSGLMFSEAEKAYTDNVFSLIVQGVIDTLSLDDPGSAHTLYELATLTIPGDFADKLKAVWDALANFKSGKQRFLDEAAKLGGKPERESITPLWVMHDLD